MKKKTGILEQKLGDRITMPLKDARDYQILFLASFLFLGILTRDWTLRLDLICVLFVSCLLTQTVLSFLANFIEEGRSCKAEGRRRKKSGRSEERRSGIAETAQPFCPSLLFPPSTFCPLPSAFKMPSALQLLPSLISIPSWRSAVITSLGLCLLLRGNHAATMAVAGCLAIASKFLFRTQGKHFFNPANFGIISALTLTHDAWISPGQWGTDWWYLLLFVGAGGIIVKRVGRWDTSVTFLGAYVGLEILRNLWVGWSWDVLQHQLMNGSLLLFAFFMITDPRSIPNATTSRIIWSIGLAILTFILQHTFYLTTAVFWSLFILSPLTIVLDTIWSASRFSWQQNAMNNYLKFNKISTTSIS
ncbi:MAG: RnfABCDGE type electron transport complex subunit D [Hydrococcus sp. Prado102]|jgi:Na+-transporting NADH:ubiquinone oxidoreductase subunit NqrB|nr:RnfABCDGE type electron transport complex subunit D [Hydrococcus sp. Prado102]